VQTQRYWFELVDKERPHHEGEIRVDAVSEDL
jgi:hypothetical protein